MEQKELAFDNISSLCDERKPKNKPKSSNNPSNGRPKKANARRGPPAKGSSKYGQQAESRKIGGRAKSARDRGSGGYSEEPSSVSYPHKKLAYAAPLQPLAPPGGNPPMTYNAEDGFMNPRPLVINQMKEPPKDHLLFNILMTLFCFWPIGICAIMRSLRVRDAITAGLQERSETLSRRAKRAGLWALAIGTLCYMGGMVALVCTHFLMYQSSDDE